MVCESWRAQLDAYLDGELPEDSMRAFDAHVHDCASCAADALARLQMKRAVQVAGKRFAPSVDFRQRMQQTVAPKPARNFNLGWILAAAAAVILVIGALISIYAGIQSRRDRVFSEIADLHVATLASSSPVDVISTDRHTVKPWFQGKIPFSFNLPELQDTGFTLVGGRMAYLDQTPGAQLDLRCSKTPYFCVCISRPFAGGQAGAKLSLAREASVQYGDLEPTRASLFCHRRRERFRH